MDADGFARQVSLRHLRCFMAVAAERHLGRAAEQLRVSQPAASKALAELESIVGYRLFERGRFGTRLTPDGEALLPHAAAVLQALAVAGDAAARTEARPAEAVTVGALPTVAPDLLPAAIEAFGRLRPGVRVAVQTAANAPLLAMLRAQAVDFALGRMADPEAMAGLAFELLYVEPLVLVVQPGHPLLAPGALTLAAILEYPLVVSSAGTIPRHNTESFLRSRGLQLPGQCIETLSVSVGRLITQRSQAVWFVPAGAVRADLHDALLARLPVSTDGTEQPVGLLHRADEAPAPAAQELVRLLRELAATRRAWTQALRDMP